MFVLFPFPFGQCVVVFPSIYGFWLSIWGLGLLCLTPLLLIFQLYRGGKSHLCRKPEYPVKPTVNFYHIMLYRVHIHTSGNRIHNFSGDIHTDWIGSCKSNYHTMTTTTAPIPLASSNFSYTSALHIPLHVICDTDK